MAQNVVLLMSLSPLSIYREFNLEDEGTDPNVLKEIILANLDP